VGVLDTKTAFVASSYSIQGQYFTEIFITTDGGNSLSLISTITDCPLAKRVKFDSSNAIYLDCSTKLFKSTDGGINFSTNVYPSNFISRDMYVTNNGDVYLVGTLKDSQGLYLGQHFTKSVANGPFIAPIFISKQFSTMGITLTSNETIIHVTGEAGTCANCNSVYTKSVDDGNIWSPAKTIIGFTSESARITKDDNDNLMVQAFFWSNTFDRVRVTSSFDEGQKFTQPVLPPGAKLPQLERPGLAGYGDQRFALVTVIPKTDVLLSLTPDGGKSWDNALVLDDFTYIGNTMVQATLDANDGTICVVWTERITEPPFPPWEAKLRCLTEKISFSASAYHIALDGVYSSRPDLQAMFPEVANGVYTNFFEWAAFFGVNEYPPELAQYAHIFDTMRVYNVRSDIQVSFPEAANGADISGLLVWGSFYGVTEYPTVLAKYDSTLDLFKVYNVRTDLQTLWPEAANAADMSGLIEWAAVFGITEYPVTLAKYQSVYDLGRVYNSRADLQGLWPEAANSAKLDGLLDWASVNGVTEYPTMLAKFDRVYDLTSIHAVRTDLKQIFPEAANAAYLNSLFGWAGTYGVNEYPIVLASHIPIYDLMRVYNDRLDLQTIFPQAANAANIGGIICWAKVFGVNEDSRLTPHSAFYDSACGTMTGLDQFDREGNFVGTITTSEDELARKPARLAFGLSIEPVPDPINPTSLRPQESPITISKTLTPPPLPKPINPTYLTPEEPEPTQPEEQEPTGFKEFEGVETTGTIKLSEREVPIPKPYQKSEIKISGEIEDYERGTAVTMIVENPDGSTEEYNVSATKDGSYTTQVFLDDNAEPGTYKVTTLYGTTTIGITSFDITQVPSWIKNNARWWSEGTITEQEFVSGIQYMMQQNIIQIKQVPTGVTPTGQAIPEWVKNTAGWWADSLVTEKEFVAGLQYLIKEGIIQIG